MQKVQTMRTAGGMLAAWALWLLALPLSAAPAVDPLTGMAMDTVEPPAAATAAVVEPVPLRGHGEQTRRWLEMQRSGEAAHGALQGLPGEVAEQVWARYVASFSHPIPERFERERMTGDGR